MSIPRVSRLTAKESFGGWALMIVLALHLLTGAMDVSSWGGSPRLALTDMQITTAVTWPAVAAWAAWTRVHRFHLGIAPLVVTMPRRRQVAWLVDVVPLIAIGWIARLTAVVLLAVAAVLGGGTLHADIALLIWPLFVGDAAAVVVGALLGSVIRVRVLPVFVAVGGYAVLLLLHAVVAAPDAAPDRVDAVAAADLSCFGQRPTVCAHPDNAAYLAPASRTLNGVYASSEVGDRLPPTVYLSDESPAQGITQHRWPQIGLKAQRALVPGDELPNVARVRSDLGTSITFGLCPDAPPVTMLPFTADHDSASVPREVGRWMEQWVTASQSCDRGALEHLASVAPAGEGR